MEKKAYYVHKGEIHDWLLDLERITTDGMELILQRVSILSQKYDSKKFSISVKESNDEVGIIIDVWDEVENNVDTETYWYDDINEPEIEDENEELKETLVLSVIDEIYEELECGDKTALFELLEFIPINNLIEYLPEEQWERFKKLRK